MLVDANYTSGKYKVSEIEHRYGKNVHILSDPYLFTTLAKLCSPQTKQPLVNSLLNTLYRELVKIVVNNEFPMKESKITSRMHALHPEGLYNGLLIDASTKVICVNLARAGTVPSQICFDAFNYILNPEGVRQDHISINRKIDENERVVGTNLGGVKIGGSIDDSFVVIPDPMGATGSTIESTLAIYKEHGKPKKFIAAHLIITPEYLAFLTKKFPDLSVYAIRLDRGLSPKEILNTVPGTHWEKEKGLNNKQYIVPGGGGLGEVINNSYV